MKLTRFAIAALMLIAAPALGQIIKPVLTPPPCSGHGCLSQRGAITPKPRKPSALETSCPAGTVYDGNKGTCKVLPGQ